MFLTRRLSIQSKLILLLLVVSLGSMIPIAILGYRSGRDSLYRTVRDHLTSLREAKAHQIRARLKLIENQVLTSSEDRMFIDAMKEFRAGFEKLQGAVLPADQEKKFREFHEKEFPGLRKKSDGKPASPASKYLLYHYATANSEPYPDKDGLDFAEDKSDYSATHKKYHPPIRSIVARFNYADILLIHPESGEVVYTVKKGAELGTNLRSGPYARSSLARLVRSVKGKEPNTCQFVDYEEYRPDRNRPAAFVASPIADEGQVIGLLVFRFPIDVFSNILTGDMVWEEDGLGSRGEVYLAGADARMRSDSRFRLDKPDDYPEILRKAGYPQKQIDAVERLETTVFTQEVRDEAFDLASKGADAREVTDYRGVRVLAAYGQLKDETPVLTASDPPRTEEGYRWVIVAKMDISEAFAPITAFQRLVGITAAITTVVVSLLAVWLSALLVRPIHRLIDGARQVSKGSFDVTVAVPTQDEFRELADSFNQMTANLKTRSELADQKARDHEQLLLSILPAAAAERFKGGEQQISDSHADVTVLFAEVGGFLELIRSVPADRAASLFNDLIIAFDEAGEHLGIEKVNAAGASYMAVCGLTVQHADAGRRMVEYARDLLRIVRHFNQERGTNLSVVVSIHSGPVVGGVVGRTRFLYDLWGDTVHIARALQTAGVANTIRVSDAVYERLGGGSACTGPEQVEVPGKGTVRVWTVQQ